MSGLYLPAGSGGISEDMQRRLQYGDPGTGWTGDPNMWFQRCDGKHCGPRKCGGQGWLLCQSMRTGRTKYVMHNPSTATMNQSVFKKLAEGDLRHRNIEDIFKEVDSENDRLQKDLETKSSERFEEGADRLFHALKREN